MSKKFVCLFLVITICFSLSACGKNQADLFDNIVSNIEELKKMRETNLASDAPFKNKWEKTYDLIKQFGIVVNLTDKIEPQPIDKAFVDAYLEKHTKEEFLENTINLFLFLRNESNYKHSSWNINQENWHYMYTAECSCQPLTTLLSLAMECNGIDLNGVNKSMKGAKGYYTEHPDAEPQPFEETHDGRFYDANGENVWTASQTDTGVVEHYGDYAIINITRYSYHSGQYGWVNGEFMDVTPYWKEIQTSILYYKGQRVFGVDFANEEEIFASNTCIVDIDGELYRISKVTLDTFDAYDNKEDTHTYLDIYKFTPNNE